jgi:hypothetical protein
MNLGRQLHDLWGSLLIAFFLSAAPMGAVGQLVFVTNNGAITITGYTGTNGNVIIPANTNGYPVTSITNSAFYQCDSLTSVAIPEGITNIGAYAFEFCLSLTNVTISDTVVSIGSAAFLDCGLSSVTIPASVADIDEFVFADCYSLTNIAVDPANPNYHCLDGMLLDSAMTTLLICPGGFAGGYSIPAGVTSIADRAFLNCGSLTSVTFPEGVTNIGFAAFANCTDLTEVSFPKSLTTIGIGAFNGCSSLTNAIFASTNVEIGDYAFQGSSLTNEMLRDLGCYLWVNNNGTLTITGFGGWGNVTIPDTIHGLKVTAIGDSAFSGANNLTNVIIPDSVTSIGDAAFQRTSLANVFIPDSVTNIGEFAFANCNNLTSVTIPKGVTSLAVGVFYSCSSLTNVVIPDSLTAIGDNTFEECLNLTGVVIPNGVTSIGYAAFAGCTSLTNLTLPESVANLYLWVFSYCTNLHAVYFTGAAPLADGGSGSLDTNLFNGESGTAYYLPGTSGWGSTFGGWPTAPWYQPNPQILGGSSAPVVRSNRFNFTVSWATNASVIVQRCTNLFNPVWTPVVTNALSNGVYNFSDPVLPITPNCYFRVQSK